MDPPFFKPSPPHHGSWVWYPTAYPINPAPNLIRDHEDLVVYGGTSIVTGRGEIPCPV
jgi:hypothetical protein